MLAGCGGSQPPLSTHGSAQSVINDERGFPACNGSRIGQAQCGAIVQSDGVRADSSSSGWTPADLQSAYALPSSTKGKGQIVAIVDAYDNPHVASDLAEYRSTFKLPTAKFTKYNQEGQTGDYPKGDKGWGIEIDNDVEMVSASCPKCTIYLIEASSSQWSDLEIAQAEAVTLDAHIVSNSFSGEGASESYWDTPGVEYVASSGGGLYDPATFVHVAAVGGTVLSKGGGGSRGWTESVSSNAGGGCSGTGEQKPPWQHDRYTKSCASRVGNDVSAVAEGVAIYDSYGGLGWTTINGTSIGAPFLSGVFALAGNATKQDGGRTFWQKSHEKYLYEVEDNGKERRFSYGAGWGTPDGIGAF